jgi:helix-turn-helix protein
VSVHAISWVLRYSEAQYGARLVLIVLADHADAEGQGAYPSIATIASEARLEDRQVQRVLGELVEARRIVRRAGRSPFGTIVYDLILDPEIPADVEARKGGDKLSGGDISDANRVADVTQTVLSNRTETDSRSRQLLSAEVGEIFDALGHTIDEASVENALARFPSLGPGQIIQLARGCAEDLRNDDRNRPVGRTFHRWLENEVRKLAEIAEREPDKPTPSGMYGKRDLCRRCRKALTAEEKLYCQGWCQEHFAEWETRNAA